MVVASGVRSAKNVAPAATATAPPMAPQIHQRLPEGRVVLAADALGTTTSAGTDAPAVVSGSLARGSPGLAPADSAEGLWSPGGAAATPAPVTGGFSPSA